MGDAASTYTVDDEGQLRLAGLAQRLGHPGLHGRVAAEARPDHEHMQARKVGLHVRRVRCAPVAGGRGPTELGSAKSPAHLPARRRRRAYGMTMTSGEYDLMAVAALGSQKTNARSAPCPRVHRQSA